MQVDATFRTRVYEHRLIYTPLPHGLDGLDIDGPFALEAFRLEGQVRFSIGARYLDIAHRNARGNRGAKNPCRLGVALQLDNGQLVRVRVHHHLRYHMKDADEEHNTKHGSDSTPHSPLSLRAFEVVDTIPIFVLPRPCASLGSKNKPHRNIHER